MPLFWDSLVNILVLTVEPGWLCTVTDNLVVKKAAIFSCSVSSDRKKVRKWVLVAVYLAVGKSYANMIIGRNPTKQTSTVLLSI